ncbi:MAG: hypothetical protein B6241_05600 [Spirochaetaceae bacterium 4572_59]|nr:MAG: hypothetical protein B6241_05600 [Spirochaetaceae bacterium 4572_59]
MNSNKNPLDSIIFISIPENLASISEEIKLDTGILLPVEIPADIPPADWQMENLNWEMIISGMLKILTYNVSHEHSQYYRDFILRVKPQIIQELTQSAIFKSQSQDFELSEEIFKALIGLQPRELRHKLNLAILFENQATSLSARKKVTEACHMNDLAEELYAQLIEQGDDLADIYFNAAWFFYSKHDLLKTSELMTSYLHYGTDEVKIIEAKKLIEEADSLKNQDNQYSEAFMLISKDQNEAGLIIIDDFLKENNSVWNAWFLKGWALRKLERYKDALQAFEQAIMINPTEVEVLNEISICYLELKNYEEAQNRLMKAFELDPENIKVISNMGILALKQNRSDEALGFFHTVLELEPKDPIATEYINYLKKAD